MAPTTDKPSLSSIDPKALAAELVEALTSHLASFAAPASPGMVVVGEGAWGDFRLSVTDLCAWAQQGQGHPEEIEDLILGVAGPMYARPADAATFEVDDLEDEADPATPLGVVLQAAWCRLQLHRGEAVAKGRVELSTSLGAILTWAAEARHNPKSTRGGANQLRDLLNTATRPGNEIEVDGVVLNQKDEREAQEAELMRHLKAPMVAWAGELHEAGATWAGLALVEDPTGLRLALALKAASELDPPRLSLDVTGQETPQAA